ncbi:MAG: hypothetical protein ACREIQ_02240, partial [Nitrospiria bacterium]
MGGIINSIRGETGEGVEHAKHAAISPSPACRQAGCWGVKAGEYKRAKFHSGRRILADCSGVLQPVIITGTGPLQFKHFMVGLILIFEMGCHVPSSAVSSDLGGTVGGKVGAAP